MITLNDYLYSGDTVLRILQKYIQDLRADAARTHNEIDLAHCNFLLQIQELLEHNDFLTAQSQQIREFYKYMAREYPFLAFTKDGSSLIRAEEKFNGYIGKPLPLLHSPPYLSASAGIKRPPCLFSGHHRLPDRHLHAQMPLKK